MPSYTQVKNVNLDKLAAAVEKWAQLPAKFSAVETTFNTEVVKGLHSSGWHGEAAEAAFAAFGDVRYDIDAAGKEAHSIHGLLSGGLRAFRSAKKQLDAIVDSVDGHEHLSLNHHDGSVYVDPDKVDPEQLGALRKTYQETIQSFRKRRDDALETADEADATLSWALKDLGGYTMGFNNGAYTSLRDAKANRARQRGDGKPLSLKQLSDQEVATQADSVPGSSTLKPAAEFLSFRPGINSLDPFMHGHFGEGINSLTGLIPSVVAGESSKQLGKRWKGGPGAGGRHRKPSLVNKTGGFGAKVCDVPAGMLATVVDYAYTPASDSEELRKKSRVVAPDAPQPTKWN